MAINLDKYRKTSKKTEPEPKESGSFNLTKYKSGTPENKSYNKQRYEDGMKSARMMEIDNLNQQKYKEQMSNARLMEIDNLNKQKSAQEQQELKDRGMDIASLSTKPLQLSTKGIQHIADTTEVKPKLPSYGERIRKELSGIPAFLQPLAAPVVALNQAPFMISARQGLGTEKTEDEKQYEFDGAAKLAGQGLNLAGNIVFSGSGGGGISNATGNLVSRYAPNLANTAGGKLASLGIKGVAEGVTTGVGQELAVNPDASAKELATSGLYGAGFGLLPAVGRGLKESFKAPREAVEGNLRVISDTLSNAREALPQGIRRTLGRSADEVVDAPITAQDTTPPYENPKLLAQWVQREGGFGDLSLNQMQRLSYDDLAGMADEIVQSRTPVKQTADVPAPVASPIEAPQAREMSPSLETSIPAYDPVQPSTRAPRVSGQRGFISSLEQSEKLTPETREGLVQSDNRNYKPLTNEETVAKANKRIEKGIDEAEAQLLGKKVYRAEDVATGMRLIDELQRAGNFDRAVTIAENVARKLTEAGQTVQAASIWDRLTPEGALLSAQRKVNRINDNLLRGQEPVKISEKTAQDILDSAGAIQAAGGSQERAGTVMQIMDRARKGEQLSPDDKQIVADFIEDAKRFVKKSDGKPPAQAKKPSEMSDKRVADRVISFLEEQEQAAKQRLRSKGVQVSSNPLDIWADYAYIGALKIAKGAVKFSDWSSQMISEFGESVRPHLRNIYEKAQGTLSSSAKKINEQAISRAEQIAESYIKTNADKLAEDDITFIRDLSQKVSSLSKAERTVASQDLQAVLNGFEKAGIGRKISSLQYISMLLNPKTQIRNIVGNELMYRLERLTKVIGTPIDIVSSKITGGPRTVTFKKGPMVWDNFFQPTKDYFSGLGTGVKAGWRGVNPEGIGSKYDIQGQAFRSKYNPVTYLEKALGASLQGFDYAAYNRATNQRLSEMAYLDAINKGIKGKDAQRAHMETFMANMDEGIHNIAKEYGKFVTLQNDSLLSQKITGFRRGLNQITAGNKDFGAGSLVVPFSKTPANLLLRALDYSPVGILKAVKQSWEVLRDPKTNLTRADVIDSVSRAILGSGVGATAYWLADKGVLFGQSNKDSETRKLQNMVGIKDFQINGSALSRMLDAMVSGGNIDAAAKIRPGDTLWSYEWAQPSSMPMAVGANVYQGTKSGQSGMRTAGEAALAGMNTIYNSSVLSGIREVFQIPSGEDNAVKAIGLNLIKQAPGMFTPSILRNINTYLDDRVKETYTPDDALSLVNSARSNIPGQSGQMPQRVDTFGKPVTKPNSFLDVFVSPADRSKYNPTPEAQFVMDLLNETGDKQVAPRAVDKYIKGTDTKSGIQRTVNLSPEQYVRLQTLVGEETAKRISKINPTLPTEKKVELVIKAMDEAGKLGRNELKKEIGLKIAR